PLLIHHGKFVPLYMQQPEGIHLVPLSESKLHIQWLDKYDRDLLESKKIDVLLSAEPDFWLRLDDGQPVLTMEYREEDQHSRMAATRLHFVLARWKKHIKEVRFVRKQLPAHFDDPFYVAEPDAEKTASVARNVLD